MTNWKWKKEVLGIKEGHHTARKIERVFYANDIHWVVSWERLNDDDGTSQITCWWCDHPPCHNHNHPLPYQLTESSCSITMNNSSNCSRKTLCGTIYIVPRNTSSVYGLYPIIAHPESILKLRDMGDAAGTNK